MHPKCCTFFSIMRYIPWRRCFEGPCGQTLSAFMVASAPLEALGRIILRPQSGFASSARRSTESVIHGAMYALVWTEHSPCHSEEPLQQ